MDSRTLVSRHAKVSTKFGECFAVANVADDRHVRRHAEEPGHQPPQVDLGPVGAGRPGLHLGHVRHRDVRLELLLGHHDPQTRVELRGRTRQQRRLAAPRGGRRTRSTAGPGRRPAGTRPPAGSACPARPARQGPERDAGELADVHKHMAAPGDVAELAVCGRGVVELGQGSARRGRRRRTPRRGSGTGPDADERRSWNRSWACPVSSSTLSEAIDGRSTCSRSPLRR
jgi:hypothetical protein